MQTVNGKKIIFIFGHPRSGTTLLNKILSAHPDIFFIGNYFNDFPSFYRRIQRYKKSDGKVFVDLAAELVRHSIDHKNPLLIEPQSFSGVKNFEEWFNRLALPAGRRPIVGVKVDDIFEDNVDFVRTFFPSAYYIHIVRDPRDVFVSWKKTSFGMYSPYYAGLSWSRAVRSIRSIRNFAQHYYEVWYEDLLRDPEDCISRLCEYIEIDFSERMMHFSEFVGEVEFHQRLLKAGFVKDNTEKWRGELTPRQIAMVTCAASREMNDFGYAVTGATRRIRGIDVVIENSLRCYSYAYHILRPVSEFIWQRSLYAIGTAGLFIKRYFPALYYFLIGKPRP
jgi:hypothetical protein